MASMSCRVARASRTARPEPTGPDGRVAVDLGRIGRGRSGHAEGHLLPVAVVSGEARKAGRETTDGAGVHPWCEAGGVEAPPSRRWRELVPLWARPHAIRRVSGSVGVTLRHPVRQAGPGACRLSGIAGPTDDLEPAPVVAAGRLEMVSEGLVTHGGYSWARRTSSRRGDANGPVGVAPRG